MTWVARVRVTWPKRARSAWSVISPDLMGRSKRMGKQPWLRSTCPQGGNGFLLCRLLSKTIRVAAGTGPWVLG